MLWPLCAKNKAGAMNCVDDTLRGKVPLPTQQQCKLRQAKPMLLLEQRASTPPRISVKTEALLQHRIGRIKTCANSITGCLQ